MPAIGLDLTVPFTVGPALHPGDSTFPDAATWPGDGREPCEDRGVSSPARACTECGHRMLLWLAPPGNIPGPRQAAAEAEAVARELDFVVVEWDPPATATLDCPECGAPMRLENLN